MLNEYFSAAVPAVRTPCTAAILTALSVTLMVTFNKRGDQPDHAERAAGADLRCKKDPTPCRAASDWPLFRVGINSGPVSVSLLGAQGGRMRTIVGDTVNIASRIEGQAPVGGVAIGPRPKR